MATTPVPESYRALPDYLGKLVKVYDTGNESEVYIGDYIDASKIVGITVYDEYTDQDGETWDAVSILTMEGGGTLEVLDSIKHITGHPYFHPMMVLESGKVSRVE